MIATLAIVVISAILVSCLAIPAQDTTEDGTKSTHGTVKGTVFDAVTNVPILGARVTLVYHEILRIENTDKNGEYTFTEVPLCFCLKNLTAAKEGYMSQEILVAVGEVTIVDFYLHPMSNTEPTNNGVVTGMVSDAKMNFPIPNALMTIEYHETTRNTYTDSNGIYSFSNVPECFCLKNVSAAKEGYESQYQLVGVYGTTYVNFSLIPLDNPQEPEEPEDPEEPEEPVEPQEPEEPEKPEEPEQHEGVVTGIVIDTVTNFPIEDVLMTLEYHDIIRNLFTDSDGEYLFDNVPECDCPKGISATKDRYGAQYIQTGVYGVTYVNFSLEPMEEPKEPKEPQTPPEGSGPIEGVITGVVKDAGSDKPIQGAIMILKYHDTVQNTITDSKGWYSFSGVPICFCLKNISAAQKGYESQYQLVGVSEVTYVNFTLEPTQNEHNFPPNSLPNSSSGDIKSKANEDEPITEKPLFYLLLAGLAAALATSVVIVVFVLTTRKRA